jgi:hypothetical protein
VFEQSGRLSHVGVHLVNNVELDEFNLERFAVQENNLGCLVELWDRDDAHLLARRTLDGSCIKSRLIADKEDVRTFLDHELIFVLERIAP